jgi:type IV pilus assembly protein PilW
MNTAQTSSLKVFIVRRATMQGFTLIEMMVAMTLSLILLGGVLSVLYSSKLTYNENARTARLQESMRAGVEIILHDLRAGGFPGCARPLDTSATGDFLSVLTSPTSLMWNFSLPVQGFDATATAWLPALPAPLDSEGVLTGNDVVVVRTVRSNARTYRLSSSMSAGTDDIVVEKLAGETLRPGVPMLISDCDKSTVFAASGVVNGSTTATLQHAVGTTDPVSATNTTANIGVFKALGNSAASVAPIDTIMYFVAASGGQDINGVSRGPALWRISSTEPATAPGTAQEVVEGVEALQVRYGEDTNGDMIVDTVPYVTADAVKNWSNVIAVSIAMVVRSPEEINPTVQPPLTFDLLGDDYTSPSDRRARAMFTTTVTLRNRTT